MPKKVKRTNREQAGLKNIKNINKLYKYLQNTDLDVLKINFGGILLQYQDIRPDIKNILKYLNKSDFYTAPSATKFNRDKEGSLLRHSLATYWIFNNLPLIDKQNMQEVSIAVICLLHDVCKTFFYKKTMKNGKWDKTGQWDNSCSWSEKEGYVVEDLLPLGHGEKSVIILQNYIDLKEEEMIAIRWHLGWLDPALHFFYPSGAPFNKALRENMYLIPLITADQLAANRLF